MLKKNISLLYALNGLLSARALLLKVFKKQGENLPSCSLSQFRKLYSPSDASLRLRCKVSLRILQTPDYIFLPSFLLYLYLLLSNILSYVALIFLKWSGQEYLLLFRRVESSTCSVRHRNFSFNLKTLVLLKIK